MPFTVPVVEKRSLWAMIGPKHYCGSWAWFNVVTGALEPFFCGSGRCPRQECRKRFWRRRVILVGDLVAEYRLTKFYTLTMDR